MQLQWLPGDPQGLHDGHQNVGVHNTHCCGCCHCWKEVDGVGALQFRDTGTDSTAHIDILPNTESSVYDVASRWTSSPMASGETYYFTGSNVGKPAGVSFKGHKPGDDTLKAKCRRGSGPVPFSA